MPIKINRFGYIVILVVFFFLITGGVRAAKEKNGHGGSSAVMTPEELQSAVISYANRFISSVGQAAFQFEEELPTPEARLVAARRKVYTLSAITEIAAGPNPGAALMDLVVMATLNRIVWEDYWRAQVFGMPATIIVDAFKKMENDAWNLASQVMTPQQLEELRDLILDWRASNPGMVSVDYIRFSDFGDLGKKPNLKEIQKSGGLLAPIREATRAADEVRTTSERAMFLATKMQLLVGFQAELVYKQLVMQPEVVKVLEDVTKFRETTERFAVLLEKLPADVAGTFANLQQTTADAERLLGAAEKTGFVFQDLVQSVDKLAAKFESKGAKEPAKPFDIKEYTQALTRIQNTVQQLNEFVIAVDQTSSSWINSITKEFNDAAEKRVDHVFWRLAELFAIIALFVIIIVVVHNLLKRRLAHRPNQEASL